MKRIKCIEYDENTCFIDSANGILRVKSDYKELAKVVDSMFCSDGNEDITVVSDLFKWHPIAHAWSVTKISTEDVSLIEDSIIIFDKMSINSILKLSINLNKHRCIAIINMNHRIMITNDLSQSRHSLNLLIVRYIESNHEVYSNCYGLNKAPQAFDADEMHTLIDVAQSKSVFDSNTVLIMSRDLMMNKRCILTDDPICCRHNRIFNDIFIQSVDKQYGDNGCRSVTPIKLINEVESKIGLMYPIVELHDQTHLDDIGISVYESKIAITMCCDASSVCGGKGITPTQAKASAIGEAFERYCSQPQTNDLLIQESISSLRKKGINFLNPSFHDVIDGKTFDEDTVIDWVLSKSIDIMEDTLIPAYFVLFPYSKKKKCYYPQDSTGLSSGARLEDAIYQGLCEYIERDAYILHYRKGIIADDIDITSIHDTEAQFIIGRILKKGLKLHIKYLKTDMNLHVIHTVIEDPSGTFPVFSRGSGASLNPNVALIRSLTECIQIRICQKILRENNGNEDDAYREWGNGNEKYAEVFIKEGNPLNFESLSNLENNDILFNIDTIVKLLKSRGYRVYVSNLSIDNLPLKVVRITIPGLLTLVNEKQISVRLSKYQQYVDSNNIVYTNEFKGTIFH